MCRGFQYVSFENEIESRKSDYSFNALTGLDDAALIDWKLIVNHSTVSAPSPESTYTQKANVNFVRVIFKPPAYDVPG